MGATTTDRDTTSKAIAKVDNSLLGMLANSDVQKRLTEVATKHLTADKLLRLVSAEVRRTPKLAECSVASVMKCVMEAARLGLQPGGALGQFYLVPFKREATPIVGYRGWITLARRSGKIRRLEAHPVYEADKFVVKFGTAPVLDHEPSMAAQRGEIVAAYMVVQMEGDAVQVEVMTRAEIDAVRNRSRSGQDGPWVTDFAEMARKTVVRRGCKYLPMDTEEMEPLSRAMELDRDDFEQVTIPHQPRKAPPSLRSAVGLPTIEASADGGEPDPDGEPVDDGAWMNEGA